MLQTNDDLVETIPAPNPENARPLTIAEFAELTDLSISTIRRRIADGTIKVHQLGHGQAIRIPIDECSRAFRQSDRHRPDRADQLDTSSDDKKPNIKKLPGRGPEWKRSVARE